MGRLGNDEGTWQNQLLTHQLGHNGRPEGHEMRRGELEQEHTKTKEHLGTDEWVPLELQVLRQLLCREKREALNQRIAA